MTFYKDTKYNHDGELINTHTNVYVHDTKFVN